MKKLLLLIAVIAVVAILVTFFSNIPKLPNDVTVKILTPTLTKQNIQTYLGIRYKMIDKQAAKLDNISEGAYITQVIDNSPAESSGFLEEDIIIEFDNKLIDGSDKQILINLISEKNPGEKVSLKIWRNKKIKNISVTLESVK